MPTPRLHGCSSATSCFVPPRDNRSPRSTSLPSSTQKQSAASWHQFLRQLHRIPSRQPNIIRRSPEPPTAGLQPIRVRFRQLDNGFSSGAEITRANSPFVHNRESCLLAGRRDVLLIRVVIEFRACRKCHTIKNWHMDQVQGRKHGSVTQTRAHLIAKT